MNEQHQAGPVVGMQSQSQRPQNIKNAAEDSASSGGDSTCVLRRAHKKLPLSSLYAEKSFFPEGRFGCLAWPVLSWLTCTRVPRGSVRLLQGLWGLAWAEQLSPGGSGSFFPFSASTELTPGFMQRHFPSCFVGLGNGPSSAFSVACATSHGAQWRSAMGPLLL